jgi:hypothetical protein
MGQEMLPRNPPKKLNADFKESGLGLIVPALATLLQHVEVHGEIQWSSESHVLPGEAWPEGRAIP